MPGYKFTKWLFTCIAIMASSSLTASPRQRIDLNTDWRFYQYADNQQALNFAVLVSQ